MSTAPMSDAKLAFQARRCIVRKSTVIVLRSIKIVYMGFWLIFSPNTGNKLPPIEVGRLKSAFSLKAYDSCSTLYTFGHCAFEVDILSRKKHARDKMVEEPVIVDSIPSCLCIHVHTASSKQKFTLLVRTSPIEDVRD